jgi:DNA polymerase III delta prime subunit
MNQHIPWVEKYRPTQLEDVALDDVNKRLLSAIVDRQSFPNLLLYGPPGTGKTTTVVNLIRAYQSKHGTADDECVIHLNASDDRGIDIIRNQISAFANSKPLFGSGMKFVVLDEVDFMTKNAQHALCCLMQQNSSTVRFCLMCNYISKLDASLQREFIRLRFNQLPMDRIVAFLKHVCAAENMAIEDDILYNVCRLYKSDIRSMINCLQLNGGAPRVISPTQFELLFELLRDGLVDDATKALNEYCVYYCTDMNAIVNEFINYIIREKMENNATLLSSVENLVHSTSTSPSHAMAIISRFVNDAVGSQ